MTTTVMQLSTDGASSVDSPDTRYITLEDQHNDCDENHGSNIPTTVTPATATATATATLRAIQQSAYQWNNHQ